MRGCVFCERIAQGAVEWTNSLAAGFTDLFPVSPGHALIVPRRHEESFFDLSALEQAAIWELVSQAKGQADADYQPAGYNLGVNAGLAAGQTIPHAHFHVIPRYTGDVKDPRGGVRWVIPEAAPYWLEPAVA